MTCPGIRGLALGEVSCRSTSTGARRGLASRTLSPMLLGVSPLRPPGERVKVSSKKLCGLCLDPHNPPRRSATPRHPQVAIQICESLMSSEFIKRVEEGARSSVLTELRDS